MHVEFFLRLPAVAGTALGKFAGDAGINSAQWVDGFDRKIGAEGEMHAGAFHAAPGVSAENAARADAVGGPALVGKQMRGLHRGDDIHVGELGEIVGRDDLGVFDAITAVALAIGRDNGGKSIEGDVIGAVADGVKGELEGVTVALDGEGFQFVGRYAHDAGGVGVVGIRGEHRGGASAERAVENFFQRAGFEPGVGGAALPPHLLQAREIDFEGQPFGDAEI